MSKKIFRVKIKYFEYFFSKTLNIPCFDEVYGEFFFNWSIETAKQFMKHLMSMQPTKFFVSSSAEVEAVTSKTDLFMKIMSSYNKIGNKKIDKFELISIIPFIVDENFDNALLICLNYFCLENESMDLITRSEVGLFIDSFFRSVHNIIRLDEKDEIYQKTKDHLIKLNENDLEEILNKIFQGDEEDITISEAIRKIPNNIKDIMKNINKGFYESLQYYGKKIREQNL
jgi:hypothetical protein